MPLFYSQQVGDHALMMQNRKAHHTNEIENIESSFEKFSKIQGELFDSTSGPGLLLLYDQS